MYSILLPVGVTKFIGIKFLLTTLLLSPMLEKAIEVIAERSASAALLDGNVVRWDEGLAPVTFLRQAHYSKRSKYVILSIGIAHTIIGLCGEFGFGANPALVTSRAQHHLTNEPRNVGFYNSWCSGEGSNFTMGCNWYNPTNSKCGKNYTSFSQCNRDLNMSRAERFSERTFVSLMTSLQPNVFGLDKLPVYQESEECNEFGLKDKTYRSRMSLPDVIEYLDNGKKLVQGANREPLTMDIQLATGCLLEQGSAFRFGREIEEKPIGIYLHNNTYNSLGEVERDGTKRYCMLYRNDGFGKCVVQASGVSKVWAVRMHSIDKSEVSCSGAKPAGTTCWRIVPYSELFSISNEELHSQALLVALELDTGDSYGTESQINQFDRKLKSLIQAVAVSSGKVKIPTMKVEEGEIGVSTRILSEVNTVGLIYSFYILFAPIAALLATIMIPKSQINPLRTSSDVVFAWYDEKNKLNTCRNPNRISSVGQVLLQDEDGGYHRTVGTSSRAWDGRGAIKGSLDRLFLETEGDKTNLISACKDGILAVAGVLPEREYT